jgi:hypothetical protein
MIQNSYHTKITSSSTGKCIFKGNYTTYGGVIRVVIVVTLQRAWPVRGLRIPWRFGSRFGQHLAVDLVTDLAQLWQQIWTKFGPHLAADSDQILNRFGSGFGSKIRIHFY